MPVMYPTPRTQEQRAQQIWSIVGSFSTYKCRGVLNRPGIITYREVTDQMGYPPGAARTIDKPLGKIARYCLYYDLPLLNTVVVNMDSGEPGHDVVLKDGYTLEELQEEVFSFNWFSSAVPSIKRLKKAQRKLG